VCSTQLIANREFFYDEDACRYYHSNGRAVSESWLDDLVQSTTATYDRQVTKLVNSLYDDNLHPDVFRQALRFELKNAGLQYSALAVGGFDRLDNTHYGRIGGILGSDYRRIDTLIEGYMDGTVSRAQALNRGTMYVGNIRRTFYRGRCLDSREGIVVIERRFLGVAEHCSDCVNYADEGWQLAGTLPPPCEDSQCRSNCRCSMHRRSIPASEAEKWIGSRRRR